MTLNKNIKKIISLVFGALVVGQAYAWPAQPIKLVVGFAPGGNTDIMARQIAPILSGKLGQPVIVENRPGAGSMIGSQYVAAATDGHTFLMGTFANVLGEFFYRNKIVDLRKDLTPVTQVLTIANYVATSPKSKINSMTDLINQAKSKPDNLSCASSGVGTSGHLACAMLAQSIGASIRIIPYRGGAPAITDVLGGHTDFLAINEVLPYIRDKSLRGLAITSEKRSPLAQELPPVSDAIPGFDLVSWYGVLAPAATPSAVIKKLNIEIVAAINEKSVQERIVLLGATSVGNTPEEFAKIINNDLIKYEKITKSLNIVLD